MSDYTGKKKDRGAGAANETVSLGDGAYEHRSACDNHCLSLSSVCCKVCQCWYHAVCAGISLNDVFSVLKPILPAAGWVCEECVGMISTKRKSLQTQLDHLSATVQKLQPAAQLLID